MSKLRYSKLKLSGKKIGAYFPLKHYISCSNITSNYKKNNCILYYISIKLFFNLSNFTVTNVVENWQVTLVSVRAQK